MLAAILARQVDFLTLVKHGIYDSARRNSRNQRCKSLRIYGIGLSVLVQQEGQEARTLASSFWCGVMLLDDFQDARPAFFGREFVFGRRRVSCGGRRYEGRATPIKVVDSNICHFPAPSLGAKCVFTIRY